MNTSTLIGRIATDLELRNAGENKVVNFNIAVDRYGKKDEVDFIPVTAFGKAAENLVAYQNKGSLVAVNGYIRQDSYALEDGTKRNTIKVIANRIQFLGSKAKTEESAKLIESDKYEELDDEDIPF